MRSLLRPFLDCRLCWRITLAVFTLILVVEAIVLIPSAQLFERNERQRIADQAQMLVEPVLARAQARGEPPDFRAVLGQYGLVGVALYAPGAQRVAAAGDAPAFPDAPVGAEAQPRPDGTDKTTLLAAWRSTSMEAYTVAARADASQVAPRVRGYLLRVTGIVVIIVLVVTIGTMLVLDVSVLRPVLRLRESSRRAGAEPDSAREFVVPTRRRDEIGELVEAHNAMLAQVADSKRRDRELAEERARYLGRHDALSGLPNRTALLEHLDCEECARGATLLLVNVVKFRALNAGFGTGLGDRLILALAARLKQAAAPGDFVAHLGADRLALARSGQIAPQAAADLAEEVLRSLAGPFELEPGASVSPALRIGIAQSGADCREGRTLLAQADLALSLTYGADELTYQFFSPALADEARSRQALARDLERALERGELFLALQPKVRLDGDLGHPVSGAEVLLRWFHAARGPVSPAEFIPVAEATGLILPIGAFVLEAACGLARDWRARLGASPRLAVNLSAQQFAQPDLCAQAARAIARAGIPPDTIEFEITETAAMKDVERTAATLAAMRELGVRVAIDDFGTGYSSLNYLRRFAVDAIKIDKSFVDEIGSDRNAEAICDAILRLGQSLGTRVVAEGVETEAQATFLRRRRCDEAQGYLYGRPVPSDEFERLYLGERVAATSAA